MMDQSSENYYIYRKPVVNIKKLFCRRHPKHLEALSNCRDYLVKTPVVDIAVYMQLAFIKSQQQYGHQSKHYNLLDLVVRVFPGSFYPTAYLLC